MVEVPHSSLKEQGRPGGIEGGQGFIWPPAWLLWGLSHER